MKRSTLKVSKTDAARRQLETAIRLWFNDGEPVSIHTLTAAAHQLVHDLGKARGVSAILRDLSAAKPEYKKKIQQIISKSENFFKHADRDPDELLDFNPESTEVYIMDAAMTYEALTSERPHILRAYQMWMTIKHPEILREEYRVQMQAAIKDPMLSNIGKQEFFTLYMALLSIHETA
jgi:hypothetical protein